MHTTETATTGFQFNEKWVDYIQNNFRRPFRFRMALLSQLPMGFLSGMRIRELTRDHCKVQVRYKWLNKNPFRSTFWAVLGMAGEMSSGALCMMYTYKQKPSIALILVENSGTYSKKAVGKTTFVCHAGQAIADAVRQAIDTGEAVQVVCPVTGYNEAGEEVAQMQFTWSMKARLPKS